MKTLKFLFIGAIALATLWACDDEEDIEPVVPEEPTYDEAYYAEHATVSSSDPYFTATEEGGEIIFKTEGGVIIVDVDCGTEWTAENQASDLFGVDWSCEAGTLTVTAEQNVIEEEQTGTVTLLTAEQRIEFATITITQNAYGAPEITVETNEWHAPAVGALTTEIAVEATADWEIENSAEWLTVTKTDTGISITADENEETEERGAKITLTCSDGIKSSSEPVAITQDGKVYISLSSEAISFYSDAGSSSVTVESNFEWEYSYDESNGWFTIQRNGDTLTATVSDNETVNDYEGTVVITAGDGEENVAEVELTVMQSGNKALIFVYTTTSANTAVIAPLSGEVDCTIDWGDGSEIETVTAEQPTHTYAEAGEYAVIINGTVTSLYGEKIAQATSKFLTAVKQWGATGLTSMAYAFYNDRGLTTIPSDTQGAFANVTTFENAFYYCNALTEIPEGLFDYCTEVTSFYRTFYYASKFTSIPKGLFDNCPKVDSFYAVFQNTKIEEIPAGLFDNCTEVTTFNRAFDGASKITTIPAGLFDNCTKVKDFTYTFSACSLLETIPSGLFDKCTEVTSFEDTFSSCKVLKSIPKGLFDSCTKVTTFKDTFDNCYVVDAIPGGLFDNCPDVETFYETFCYCQAIKEIPKGLFDKCSKASNFRYTFEQCNALESIPEGLFDNCPLVTIFYGVFAYCTTLTEIPAGLFDKCPIVDSFYQVFYECKSLKSIPSGLFDNCPIVTTFAYAFSGCPITEIPTGLFDKCPLVTTFQYVFETCAEITAVPEGLFDNCPEVTSFVAAFKDASKLASVRSDIFAKCPKVTSFQYTFQNCVSLTEIPSDIFVNNTAVTDFRYTFSGCTGLTSVSNTLFANCPEVTTFLQTFSNCTELVSLFTANDEVQKPILFSNNKKVTSFSNTFLSCSKLTCESPYDVMEIDENEVNVHLYERLNDEYKSYYSDVSSITSTKCFNGCTGLTDYDDIPSGWK